MKTSIIDISNRIEVVQHSTKAKFPARFTLGTWNLLAPCWKRTKEGRESANQEQWQERQKAILDVLEARTWDAVFLQEVWFVERYKDNLQRRFAATHHIIFLQQS